MRINLFPPFSALALRDALRRARASDEACEIVFGPGCYYLTETTEYHTMSIAHDEGCGKIEQKEIHILLEEIHDLTISGSVDSDGNLQTVLVAQNTRQSQTLLPTLLWAEGCRNLKITHVIFGREPSSVLSGIVEKVEGNRVFVSLSSDIERPFPLYCMNVVDEDRKLRVESLTYGFGNVPVLKPFAHHRYLIEDPHIAAVVHAGQLFSAHQAGKTDFLLFFSRCDNLRLEDIWIQNSNSMALLTEQCKHITAERVRIKNPQEGCFAASRDGWKVYRCSGTIDVHDCHIEGVRMDGQNIHSNFLRITKILDAYSVLCTCPYVPLDVQPASFIAFGGSPPYQTRTLKSGELVSSEFVLPVQDTSQGSAIVVGRENRINTYRFVFDTPIDEICSTGSLLRALCWEVDAYCCRNSVFSNVAGAGILLRCSNAVIENNQFLHCMNAGVLVGAELATHQECSHVRNLLIQNNIFRGNGFKSRYGQYGRGGVAIHSQGFSTPCNQEISIIDNIFYDGDVGIEISCASKVFVAANQYHQITKRVWVDQTSCSEVINKDEEN